jgi:hypothetical protein
MNDKQSQRVSNSHKNADKKQWYKNKINLLDQQVNDVSIDFGNVSEYRRQKVNYDLFNNILDLSDFEYVCKPFGAEAGELPAKMVNRDIVSGKIKSMLGMEMKRPFSFKVLATNPEATTRREQEEFGRVRDFVINQTMQPIKEQIEIKYQQEQKGRELTEQEIAELQQKIAEEVENKTPNEIKKYMEREYQDPAEVLTHQLLEYLTQKCGLKKKFNTAFKHGLLSAKEVMYVGILNGEPEVWNVNSLEFTSEKSPDNEFIEDGENASCNYKMTPSDIIKYFGDVLKSDEIDRIYEAWGGDRSGDLTDDLFALNERVSDHDNNATIDVLHGVWKSLRQIGFLYFLDKQGEEQLKLVDEKYKINVDAGDIRIEWEWIPEVYETWKVKIAEPIYLKMQPIPGQFKDLDNLYHCKLPYYGAIYDNLNSQETSLMDRLKVYQYYYNIVMYRLELLLASDKGKKVLMNINMIPDSAGIDIKKWQYFMESTPYMWYDPNEEGTQYNDANTVAKVIDLSMVSDIQKYIEIAEYLRTQCGRSVGITDSVEGQIGADQSVQNAQQNLTQTSHILEIYFNLHDHVKKNVLQGLIETAKIAYSNTDKKKLNYFLDDMSRKIIDLDVGLLDNSTLGLFIENATKAQEVLDILKQLTHAAMQNQKIELSDVITTIRQEGLVEAEETLKVAEKNRRKNEMAAEAQRGQQAIELEQKKQEGNQAEHKNDLEKIVLKEEEKRKTVIVQSSLMAASFNPDQDKDKDGVNDFIELARNGLDADIKQSQKQLDREKFEHQKETDVKKLKQTDTKLENDKAKIEASKSKSK